MSSGGSGEKVGEVRWKNLEIGRFAWFPFWEVALYLRGRHIEEGASNMTTCPIAYLESRSTCRILLDTVGQSREKGRSVVNLIERSNFFVTPKSRGNVVRDAQVAMPEFP